jgi:MSHA biogenesis protein MshQ
MSVPSRYNLTAMFLRRLTSLLLALMLFAAGGPAWAGTTYTFNGAAVGSCALAGATYTCASLPLTGWDDAMVIASGYTVKITSDVSFGYNHSLTMSGNAVLASTGNLDISGVKSDNLQISGGTLVAANTFSVGSVSQSLTANIQAGDAHLGTGSGLTLTGNVTATGTVDIATHATISGTINAATVNANPGAALVGDVVATKSFTLGSQGSVEGNITAPVVSLLPAKSVVTGNITAKVSLELGSHVSVEGNVVAGTLTLNPAFATIDGSATVDSAVLGSHTRVTEIIHCTGGTTAGRCDCVTNNSGYEVNTDYGPRCEGNAVALDHFVIGYDRTGSVCTPSTVTITACANAACTSTYGGGANVVLAPTGQAVAIPASGSAQASVAWPQTGINTLGLTGATAVNPTTCWRSGDAAPGANCQVDVARAAYTLSLGTAGGYTSEAPQTLTVTALQQSDNGSCVPLFKNVQRSAAFSCAYSNPSTGTAPVRLNNVVLRGQATGSACDGGGPSIALHFNADGVATLPLQYADAGKVTVTINDTGAGSPGTASVTPVFVPAKFQIALPGGPYVAGQGFKPTVTALNASNNPTPNFGRESPGESVKLEAAACKPNTGNGQIHTSAQIDGGVETFDATWSETGTIDLVASLQSGSYLGSKMAPLGATTNTMAPDCSGAAGPFSPAYFTVDVDPTWQRKATTTAGTSLQYYSGEPAIKLTVTARNLQNGVTQNYTGSYAHDLTFTALDPAGGALLGASGKFSRSTGYPASDLTGTAQIRALDFGANGAAPGVATWTGSFTFAKSPSAQTRLRVRVSELPSLPHPASSATIPATVGAEPVLMIRSGRVRLPSRFGSAGMLLKIPVSLEYYTGQTWALNAEDSTTAIPAGAVLTGPFSTDTDLGTINSDITAFANGTATLSLTPAKSNRGSIAFALDLGSDAVNTSCYAAKLKITPTTSPAGLPFLRSVDASCTAAGAVDPSALATFGVYAPETKRIIHMREVFK